MINMKYTNVFFVLLLFAVMIFVSGCGSPVPAKYKDNKCSSLCYPSLNGIDPKAVEMYKQNKAIFDQVDMPVCRNLRELNWTEQQIKDLACSGQTVSLTGTCNGCDTFCDCQLKDGRYLVPIVYGLWKQTDIPPNTTQDKTSGLMNSGLPFVIKVPSNQKSIKSVAISGSGKAGFNTANITIYAFNLTAQTLSDDKASGCYILGKDKVLIKNVWLVNSEQILYGPTLLTGSENWSNIHFANEITLPQGLDVFVQVSGIDINYHKSATTEGNYYRIVPAFEQHGELLFSQQNQMKCMFDDKDFPPIDLDIVVS